MKTRFWSLSTWKPTVGAQNSGIPNDHRRCSPDTDAQQNDKLHRTGSLPNGRLTYHDLTILDNPQIKRRGNLLGEIEMVHK